MLAFRYKDAILCDEEMPWTPGTKMNAISVSVCAGVGIWQLTWDRSSTMAPRFPFPWRKWRAVRQGPLCLTHAWERGSLSGGHCRSTITAENINTGLLLCHAAIHPCREGNHISEALRQPSKPAQRLNSLPLQSIQLRSAPFRALYHLNLNFSMANN